MEGGETMGKGRRDMEGNFHMIPLRHFWGLRPWRRHGLILMVAGLMYILVGFAYILAGPNPTRNASLVVLLSIAPLSFWGGVFIFCGLLSMISSRWPPFTETWGYMVLTGVSLGWGSAYLLGVLFYGAPWTNINGFLTWGLLGFIWWAISGLLNPDKTAVTNNGGSS